MSLRWRRILIGLGITVVVCGVYAWFFGFQTMMIWEMRKTSKRAPVVRLVPRGLPDSSVSSREGKTLSYFGYKFEVPWTDVDESRTKLYATSVAIGFSSGKTIVFKSLPRREFVNAVLKETDERAFRQAYGGVLQSDYALWSAVAHATPDKVTLFTPSKDIMATSMLLLLKATAAPEQSAIYSIQNTDFKGFQWGDPNGRPRQIVADLFADDAGLEIMFFGPGKGQPLGISQADINRVLQTVHKTADTRDTQALNR
jgi:hypothetical protein